MISAMQSIVIFLPRLRFSAIARSVMISALLAVLSSLILFSFSAIARSVMISASRQGRFDFYWPVRFSAIARSVMISAIQFVNNEHEFAVSVL